MAFRRGGEAALKAQPKGPWELGLLPESEREQLCRDLLAEFGVTRIVRKSAKGDLIHSCPMPGGAHPRGDTNASAGLNFKKLTFKCFGCGASGGLLWFIATCRGEDAPESREWLERATGTGGQTMDLGRLLELLDAMEASPEAMTPIPRYPSSRLDSWDFIHPYMTEVRGVPEETLDHFRVGFAHEYRMGYGETQPRITIPLFWKGHLAGWQARALMPEDEPKYKNSPDFPRERAIYNQHEGDTCVLVESPLSVLRHFHHVPTLCSTFGASVSEVQLRELHRHSRVVIWFDNDRAGWKGTRLVGNALERYCQVWAVESPYDADPADMDDRTVEKLIENAVPYPVWELPSRRLIKWRS